MIPINIRQFANLSLIIIGIYYLVLCISILMNQENAAFAKYALFASFFVFVSQAFLDGFIKNKSEEILHKKDIKIWSIKLIAIDMLLPTACVLWGLYSLTLHNDQAITSFCVVFLGFLSGSKAGEFIRIRKYETKV